MELNLHTQEHPLAESELIPTRASLLARIKDLSASDSWLQFFDTYWKLLYNTARKCGLPDAEAQDVVQDTFIAVSKSIGKFEYRPGGSFKRWLCQQTLWKIRTHLRSQQPHLPADALEELPDPAGFDELWDSEWERNLAHAALEIVKRNIGDEKFQIYSLCVLQNRGPAATAEVFGLKTTAVYLLTHRVNKAVLEQMEKLRKLDHESAYPKI
jgi:RNA polymerase sigma factor (sigma-70 family)